MKKTLLTIGMLLIAGSAFAFPASNFQTQPESGVSSESEPTCASYNTQNPACMVIMFEKELDNLEKLSKKELNLEKLNNLKTNITGLQASGTYAQYAAWLQDKKTELIARVRELIDKKHLN